MSQLKLSLGEPHTHLSGGEGAVSIFEVLADGGDDAATLRTEGCQAVDLEAATALHSPLGHFLDTLAARVQKGRRVDALRDPPMHRLYKGRLQKGTNQLSCPL